VLVAAPPPARLPHALDVYVPVVSLVGVALLLVGNSLLLGSESAAAAGAGSRPALARVGVVAVAAGVALTLAAALAQIFADALSTRAASHEPHASGGGEGAPDGRDAAAAAEAAGTGTAGAGTGGTATRPAASATATTASAAAAAACVDDHDAVTTALDHPAALLNAAGAGLILAALGCAISATWGGAGDGAFRVLLVAGAVATLAATALFAAAEGHRAWDVAEVVRGAGGGARGGGGPPSPRRLCAAVDALEARHGRAARGSTGVRALAAALAAAAALCARAPPPQRSVTLAEWARAQSPLVAAAAVANVAGAAALLAGAVLLLSSAPRARGFVALEVSFALFFLGVALVLGVGAAKVAAHRRGGRKHLEYDARRVMARAARRR